MKENENSIGYYSVIPATVLYNKELKAKMFRIIRLQQETYKLIGKKLNLEVWQKINRNKL